MDEIFQALAGWLSLYGYPILFAAVLAESAGLPVPGETAVLLSGLLASRPGSPLSLVWVMVVAAFAAVMGDNLGFWLGRRWARRRLQQGKRFLFLTPRTLQVVEGYFEHYGALTIFFARFILGLRVVAALAAGTSRMAWPGFLMANAGGAVAWAVSMSLLGYYCGQSWDILHRWLGRGGLIILGCAVLLLGLPYLWRRVRRMPTGSWDGLLRSQVSQGMVAAALVVVCLTVLAILAERHLTPLSEDRQVKQWISDRQVPWLDAVATAGSYLGSLPAVVAAVALFMVRLWYAGRSWREAVALLWALVASEGVGLILLGLLRHEDIEPGKALAWPFGFAGLAPLRGAAVYGMMAHLFQRPFPAPGRPVWALAVTLAILIGFSVVWSHEQLLTEVFVEYVAGCMLLFLGMCWLEGKGWGPQVALPTKGP